jgi:hypothetical protein
MKDLKEKLQEEIETFLKEYKTTITKLLIKQNLKSWQKIQTNII